MKRKDEDALRKGTLVFFSLEAQVSYGLSMSP